MLVKDKEGNQVEVDLDFEDPAIKGVIDARVIEETKKERGEYNDALEAYQKEAVITTHPAYQQLKSIIQSDGSPTVTDGPAGPTPQGGGDGGGGAAPNAFERYMVNQKRRIETNIKDPAVAQFLHEELRTLAGNLIQSGVGSAKGAEENVTKELEKLRTHVQGQEGKSIVQNLYFLDTEIMPGVKMSNLQALGISPTDVATELTKYAAGHEKVVISSMIANKQHEAVGELVKKDTAEAENLSGMGVPGPTRKLKLSVPDHKFGDRPSLDRISQDLGKQMGASPEEVNAKFAEVR